MELKKLAFIIIHLNVKTAFQATEAQSLCGSTSCCHTCCQELETYDVKGLFHVNACHDVCEGDVSHCNSVFYFYSVPWVFGCQAGLNFIDQNDLQLHLPLNGTMRSTCCFEGEDGNGTLKFEEQCVTDHLNSSSIPTKSPTNSPSSSPT